MKAEPTILIALRGHADGLCMTVRVNRGNQQMEQTGMWAWRDLASWRSQSGEAAARTLAYEANRMAKRMRIYEAT